MLKAGRVSTSAVRRRGPKKVDRIAVSHARATTATNLIADLEKHVHQYSGHDGIDDWVFELFLCAFTIFVIPYRIILTADMGEQDKMRAVIFNGPWKIDVEDRPKPKLLEPTDAIVKVSLAGLCGSELHMYRGHQATKSGHIMVSVRLL